MGILEGLAEFRSGDWTQSHAQSMGMGMPHKPVARLGESGPHSRLQAPRPAH